MNDLLCLGLGLPAAMVIRAGVRHGASIDPGDALPLLALWLLAWSAAASGLRVYTAYRTLPLTTELWRITRALLGAALLTVAGGYLLWRLDVPRLLLVSHFAVSLALLLGSRVLIRLVARAARRRGYNARRVAVVGTGALAEEVARTFMAHPEWGCELSGIILEAGATPPAAEPLPLLGRVDEMGAVLERHVLDQVIFALPSIRLPETEEAARACQEQGVAVMICLDLLHGGFGQMALTQLEGLPALTYCNVPTDALALAGKRAFDVLVSATILLLLAPVLAGVALAIRLDSPGPVFFKQRRVGLRGRHFWLYKFRSMRPDAEAQLESLRVHNEVSGPVFKMSHDPRITRIGRFIRKTSLDEFPQFWNVLRGEMSVVGPRPQLPKEVLQYERWQRRRLSVKPGITCTWQVSGRNDIAFDRWMELDLEYIDTWSLARDVGICLRTVPAVLSARGVH